MLLEGHSTVLRAFALKLLGIPVLLASVLAAMVVAPAAVAGARLQQLLLGFPSKRRACRP
jgi:hypothetical protein